MPVRVMDAVDRSKVEVLHIDDLTDFSLFEKVYHRRADPADGPAHFDTALVHVLL